MADVLLASAFVFMLPFVLFLRGKKSLALLGVIFFKITKSIHAYS